MLICLGEYMSFLKKLGLKKSSEVDLPPPPLSELNADFNTQKSAPSSSADLPPPSPSLPPLPDFDSVPSPQQSSIRDLPQKKTLPELSEDSENSSESQKPSHVHSDISREKIREVFSDVPPVEGSQVVDQNIPDTAINKFDIDKFVLPTNQNNSFKKSSEAIEQNTGASESPSQKNSSVQPKPIIDSSQSEASPFSSTSVSQTKIARASVEETYQKPLAVTQTPKIEIDIDDSVFSSHQKAKNSAQKETVSAQEEVVSTKMPANAVSDSLYIDIQTYEDVQKRLVDLQAQLTAAGSNLDKILSERKSEDKNFGLLIKEIEQVQNDLIKIDGDIFQR